MDRFDPARPGRPVAGLWLVASCYTCTMLWSHTNRPEQRTNEHAKEQRLSGSVRRAAAASSERVSTRRRTSNNDFASQLRRQSDRAALCRDLPDCTDSSAE